MLCSECLNLDSNGNGVYCMIADCGCSLLLPKVECPNYEPKPNLKSVKWVLQSLNCCEYCHILVRRKGRLFGQTETLGGGSAHSIIRRFGSELVYTTEVVENSLVIYIV